MVTPRGYVSDCVGCEHFERPYAEGPCAVCEGQSHREASVYVSDCDGCKHFDLELPEEPCNSCKDGSQRESPIEITPAEPEPMPEPIDPKIASERPAEPESAVGYGHGCRDCSYPGLPGGPERCVMCEDALRRKRAAAAPEPGPVALIDSKIAAGSQKSAPFLRALTEVWRVSMFGESKHGANNWQSATPEGLHHYEDALWRHWIERRMGETHADDSKCLHLAHCAWNALLLLEMELRGAVPCEWTNEGEREPIEPLPRFCVGCKYRRSPWDEEPCTQCWAGSCRVPEEDPK